MIERISARLKINRQPKEKPFEHKTSIPHRVLLEILSYIYTPRITVGGIENIQKAQELLSENKRLIILSNHLTNADAEVIYQALKRKGHKNLVKRLFFLEGEKLRRNLITKTLARSQNGLFVWPKSLPPQNEEEARRQRIMNFNALRNARKRLEQGRILVTFPEGGRSYAGSLKQGESEIAH